MGSVNAPGVTVVNKYTTANLSTIKLSRRVKQNVSDTDTQTTLQADAVTRDLGSELVVGMTLPGRNVNARIASEDGATRSLSVNLAGNTTQGVIPSALTKHTPQEGAKSTGNRVVVGNTVGDTSTRVAN